MGLSCLLCMASGLSNTSPVGMPTPSSLKAQLLRQDSCRTRCIRVLKRAFVLKTVLDNDFDMSADQLLDHIMNVSLDHHNDFAGSIREAQSLRRRTGAQRGKIDWFGNMHISDPPPPPPSSRPPLSV